jgi:hypothetical protein
MITMGLMVSYNVYSTNNLKVVRDYYYSVCLKDTSVIEFEEYLNSQTNSNTVEIKGYRAIICFLKADYYVNPFKKWDSFKKGKEQLDAIISKNKRNIELRFLRLTIQDNLPSFLNYDKNIKEDKDYIFKQLHTILDEDLKQRISNYLRYNSMISIK